MGLMLIFCTLSALAACYGTPLSREKRYAPYAGGYAYAGPGFPYGGAFAGAGAGFNPFAAVSSPWNYPTYPRNYMPFPWFPFPMFPVPINWYDGENVCKEVRNVNAAKTPDDLNDWLNDDDVPNVNADYSHEQQSCKGSNTKFVCIKRIDDGSGQTKLQATKYECCHGFVRNPNGPGCIESSPRPKPPAQSGNGPTPLNPNDKVYYGFIPQSNSQSSDSASKIDLKNILPTLRSMGATEFVSMADEASMTDTLHTGNYTIFCPLNSALESVIEDEQFHIENEIAVKPNHRGLKTKSMLLNLLTDHMMNGFYKSDDFRDGQVIGASNQNSQLRMNIYYIPEKIVTANCVPIVSGDHFARNGIIHVVEKVLPMPSRTVADVIAGDAQFSTLKAMLSQAGLVQTLRNPNKTFTVFAPTDSAFSPPHMERETESINRCAVSVMRHHIIDHVICSPAIPQYAKSLNLNGELLSLSRDEHNKLYVDDVQIVVRDLVATNGVVHVIDGVLSTRQAKSASQILSDYGLNEFLSLLEIANLKTLYDSLENVTFFIPSNEAIQALPPRLLESLISNIDSLFSILLYHVADGQAQLNISEQVLDSKLENTSIRLQLHSPYPHSTPQILVQCGTVLSPGNKMCGGSLNVISKLLLPPKLSIIAVLEGLEGFSTLVLLLRATGLERRLKSPDAHYTLLAPTDDAFHQMGQDTLFRLLEDLRLATDLLKMHILSGAACCSQLKSDLLSGRPQIRAIDGSILRLDRYREGVLRIGGAHIVDCDIMATNGVMHMVDAIVRQKDIDLRNGGYPHNVLIRI